MALSLTQAPPLQPSPYMIVAKTFLKNLSNQITAYEPAEAEQIAFLVLNTYFNISRTDIHQGVQVPQKQVPTTLIDRINTHEPIQYILGHTYFCDLKISVNAYTLIPRPETEELVQYAVKTQPNQVLDLGTGSGCIAIAIAAACPQASVHAVDISPEALSTARANALSNAVNITFHEKSILDFNWDSDMFFDLIVSNPPYVLDAEKKQMAANVLEYEPHLALFVPDIDPLLFYKAIANIALEILKPGGKIMLEINQAFGPQTLALFQNQHFCKQQIQEDFYGKPRFVFAERI